MRRPCRETRAGSTRRWATTSSRRDLLLKELYADGANENSSHDFGRDILPGLIGKVPMYAYDFQTNRIPGDPPGQPVYWRDVGTIDAYYDANMDLRAVTPVLNLYNRQWPLRTAGYSDPPAKFTFDEEGRRGQRDRLDRVRRRASCPAGSCGGRSSAAAFACIPAPISKTASSSTTATSAGMRRCATRDSRQERARAGRRRDRLRPR